MKRLSTRELVDQIDAALVLQDGYGSGKDLRDQFFRPFGGHVQIGGSDPLP